MQIHIYGFSYHILLILKFNCVDVLTKKEKRKFLCPVKLNSILVKIKLAR